MTGLRLASNAYRLAAGTIIVVPCFNEAARLPRQRFVDFAAGHRDIGFVFVDDGSGDGTRALLESLREEAPGSFSLLALAQNGGKGEAVRRGLIEALSSGPIFVGYWDADLATPLDELPHFIAIGRQNPGVFLILGARVRRLGSQIERSFLRHCIGRVFATVASRVLGLPVYDTQCGAKVIRVDQILHDVLAKPFRGRWTFDVELMQRLVQGHRHLKPEDMTAVAQSGVIEVPLNRWSDVAGSKVKIEDGLRAFLELALMWIEKQSRTP
jgi:dolichyl-phosphate beta-glucosyltransferase